MCPNLTRLGYYCHNTMYLLNYICVVYSDPHTHYGFRYGKTFISTIQQYLFKDGMKTGGKGMYYKKYILGCIYLMHSCIIQAC